MAHLKGLERKGEIMPQMNRQQAIIKLGVEIKNRTANKYTKNQWKKSWFFEKIGKTDKPWAKLAVEGGDPD